jgi:hypothetical protein
MQHSVITSFSAWLLQRRLCQVLGKFMRTSSGEYAEKVIKGLANVRLIREEEE